jgi:hypothetical protein
MKNKTITRDEFINLFPGSIITNQLTSISYKIVQVFICARREMEVVWADAVNTSTNEQVKITYHRHWVSTKQSQAEMVAA